MTGFSFKKIPFKSLIAPLGAVLCFLVTEIASKHPTLTEHYYSNALYPVLAKSLSFISSVFTFSLSDSFYVLLGLSFTGILIALVLRKIKVKRGLLLLLNILSSIYILFYVLWGFNYFRLPLSERLELQESNTNKDAFLAVCRELVHTTNRLHCSMAAMDKKQMDTDIEQAYKKLAPLLQINYPMGTRPDKKISFSSFYAKTGISGYYGPFFNEVHVNPKVTDIEYPFVLAHEKAHQLGITSEAEANFYAWLVCSHSASQPINYSGNLIVLRHFLRQAYYLPEYPKLVEGIAPEVKKDILAMREHWRSLRNEKMDKAASKVNDAYLKTNKIEKGIQDYHGVVKHVMNFSLDSAFQRKHAPLIKIN